MSGPENRRQLPACPKEQSAAAAVMQDFFRPDRRAFQIKDQKILSEKLAAASGCSRQQLLFLLQEYLHLPCDEHLRGLIEGKIKGWLPVFLSGGVFCGETSRQYAEIAQTVRLSDPEFNPEKGRWSVCFHVERGPLCGRKMTFQVSPRQAKAMLISCIGVRMAHKLDYARPYDLDGMILLTGFRRNRKAKSPLSIARFYRSPSLQQKNRKLERRRLSVCEKNIFRKICFDCGAGKEECRLARHSKPLAADKECVICRTTKRRTNRFSLCTKCTERLVTAGTLPRPEKKS